MINTHTELPLMYSQLDRQSSKHKLPLSAIRKRTAMTYLIIFSDKLFIQMVVTFIFLKVWNMADSLH
jgi:hypothetical protein